MTKTPEPAAWLVPSTKYDNEYDYRIFGERAEAEDYANGPLEEGDPDPEIVPLYRGDEIPAWQPRPMCPGLWLIEKEDGGLPFPHLALELTQDDIDRGAPFDAKRVYGPIPEQGGAT